MQGQTIRRALTRFKQLGSFQLLREYARYGILRKSVIITLQGFLKGKELKVIYAEILRLITPAIEKRYSPNIPVVINRYKNVKVSNEKSNFVWFCWLQGLENAPELVKRCYANLGHYLNDKQIVVVDESTLGLYVSLPEIIVERWKKHQIPAALYSDVIRLELLIKYGGIWIDSTVLCTGFEGEKGQKYKAYLESELFMFQFRKSTDDTFRGISNWFITARPGHPVLMMVRDLLVEYWKENECVLSFFIFHIFFSQIVKQEPSLIENMPYGYSPNSLFLEHHLGDKFNMANWKKLVSRVCFHKLTYRLDKGITDTPGNFYDMIVRGNLFIK